MRSTFAFGLLAGCLAAVVACSEDPPAGGASSSSGGSSSGTPEAGPVAEADAGAGEDAAEADDSTQLTPTKKTSLDATINTVVRTLDRAQYGVTKVDDTLYLEAYEGGVAACPEVETPKRTLIVRDVPRGALGTKFTKSDGVGVTLLDFAGDQINADKPSTTATALTVTIVDITEDDSVEIEVDATFPEGTAKGRIYATYCAEMNE